MNVDPVFKARFDRLKAGIKKRQATAQRHALTKAPTFNVFQILGPSVSRSEVGTHSAFLANLLNPQGTHGQGNLFLHTFLDYCVDRFDDFPMPETDAPADRWLVQTELGSHLGRLDIVLQNPAAGYLCLIENKVDAWEQPDQLRRYWQWMELRKQGYPSRALVFLTVSGYEAYTAADHAYFQISYREDIPAWLDAALPEVEAPAVREVVRQYWDLVKSF